LRGPADPTTMLSMPQLIVSVEGVEIKQLRLRRGRTTLGRSPENDIVLENMVVSGHHCEFELGGQAEVYIEDLSSTNGTYIGGKLVKRQRLNDGDVIEIGNFRIQFLEDADRPSGFSTETMTMTEGENSARTVHAIFQVLNGSSAGLEMPVVKAVTTFGKPGVCVVAVSHRRDGFYVAFLEGANAATLNGDAIGDNPMLLSDHDVLELASTRMLFLLKE
jgi:pSer/pThr/pTyr-binding forkhead associated (FHA) protein